LNPWTSRSPPSSLFVSKIAKIGHIDPSLPEDEPFLSAAEADKFPLSLLPHLTVCSISSDATMRTELFCWCGADDLIFAATSEFLLVAPKVKKNRYDYCQLKTMKSDHQNIKN
jgi:hypothetical protein